MPRFWEYLSDSDKAKLKAEWPKIRPPDSDGSGVVKKKRDKLIKLEKEE